MAVTVLVLAFGTLVFLAVIPPVGGLLTTELLRLRGVATEESYGALYRRTLFGFSKAFGLLWLSGAGLWFIFSAAQLFGFLTI